MIIFLNKSKRASGEFEVGILSLEVYNCNWRSFGELPPCERIYSYGNYSLLVVVSFGEGIILKVCSYLVISTAVASFEMPSYEN